MENKFEGKTDVSKLEKIIDIEIKEVFVGDEDYEKAKPIHIREGATKYEAEDYVRKFLISENWWLEEDWENKEIKEQIILKINGTEISVFNFNEPLNPAQIDEIKYALVSVFNLNNKEIFDKVHSILIDSTQLINQNSGENANGYGAQNSKAIKLYPNALKQINHRVQGVSNLEATIIHELSHSIGEDFQTKWRAKFGWKPRQNKEKLEGEAYSYEYCEKPNKCVTDYAKINATEDICESMVAALRNPDILDPERLDFIKSSLFPKDNKKTEITVEKRSSNQITFPNVKQPVLYKRLGPKIIWNTIS